MAMADPETYSTHAALLQICTLGLCWVLDLMSPRSPLYVFSPFLMIDDDYM